jgi:hypothetical protein
MRWPSVHRHSYALLHAQMALLAEVTTSLPLLLSTMKTLLADSEDTDSLSMKNTRWPSEDSWNSPGANASTSLRCSNCLHLLHLLVAPGPDPYAQHGNDQQHRPGKAQRLDQTGQAPAAGKPDHHFAVAVHAGERADNGDKQAQAQNGGQMAEHGEAHDQHHVGGLTLPLAAWPRVRISIMVMTTVINTTSRQSCGPAPCVWMNRITLA